MPDPERIEKAREKLRDDVIRAFDRRALAAIAIDTLNRLIAFERAEAYADGMDDYAISSVRGPLRDKAEATLDAIVQEVLDDNTR